MVIIRADKVYINARIYFAHNILDKLPNDDKVWAKVFKKWLRSQGATIVRNRRVNFMRDSLGVASGYDKIKFNQDKFATVFLMRWS